MLFYEKGYHGTSMREIADAVGIKAGSLYNHFAGKQEILYRIALGSIQELLDGGTALAADHADAPERLHAFVRFHVEYHAQFRYRAKVADDQLHALSPAQLESVLDVRDAYQQILKDTLAMGRDQHDWLVEDVAVTTFAIATMCTAVGVWFREGGRLSPAEVADIYAGFILRGVRESEHIPAPTHAGGVAR